MSLYEEAGEHGRLLAMTTSFYARAVEDDVIGEMFSRAAGDHAEHLAGWLSASFGGPPDYLKTRGDLRFVVWKHAGLKITEAQRARWARLMMDSALEVGMSEAFMSAYARFVDGISRSVRDNSNEDMDVMRAQLGLGPGESLEPIVPDGRPSGAMPNRGRVIE